MKFLRNFFASLLALILFSLGVLFIFISIATADQLVVVEEGSVLNLSLNKPITERELENPFEGLPIPGPASSIGLAELRSALSYAKEDARIEGIYLNMEGFAAGMSNIEEIRTMILDFRESGKFVYAYARNYGEGGYFLASAADSVFMHPEGSLEFNGLTADVMFLKGMFDKVGLEPQIFRVGEFKSAVEPFMRTDMSEASRLQLTEMIEGVNGHMVNEISESRGIDADSLQNINDGMLVRDSRDALAMSMVDALYYDDEFRSFLTERSGADELNLVSYGDYRKSYTSSRSGSNRIAVIVASGDIIQGKGGNEVIGSDQFVKAIREARESDRVKAIVLRVNSPGGSYLASDAIWREVKLASEEKPVIASMSNYAASGGYYIAMASDTIVAQPTTITGSIGIFSILFNTQELFEDKLGITFDGVSTGEYSDLYTSVRSLRPEEKAIIQRGVEDNYDTFIRKAAEGRDMSDEDMRAIASGRVWTGIQAKENGLVDILGDLQTAVDIAADKAEITDDYYLRYYPPQQSVLDELLGVNESSVREKALKEELGMLYPYVKELRKLEQLKGVQARSLYSVRIY